MFEYAEGARGRGLACIIAGAGGAAHLPGMIASKTTLPVLGVPVPSRHLAGQDSLYSIVQMPKGIPVATFAIGEAGAANAGLFAVSLLAGSDAELARKLAEYREQLREQVAAMQLPNCPTCCDPPGRHARPARRRPAGPHVHGGRAHARLPRDGPRSRSRSRPPRNSPPAHLNTRLHRSRLARARSPRSAPRSPRSSRTRPPPRSMQLAARTVVRPSGLVGGHRAGPAPRERLLRASAAFPWAPSPSIEVASRHRRGARAA